LLLRPGRNVDRAIAKVELEVACGNGFARIGQGLAATIRHSCKSPLQRTVGMGKLRQSPKRRETVLGASDPVGQELGPKARSDRAQVGPGVRGPGCKGPR